MVPWTALTLHWNSRNAQTIILTGVGITGINTNTIFCCHKPIFAHTGVVVPPILTCTVFGAFDLGVITEWSQLAANFSVKTLDYVWRWVRCSIHGNGQIDLQFIDWKICKTAFETAKRSEISGPKLYRGNGICLWVAMCGWATIQVNRQLKQTKISSIQCK